MRLIDADKLPKYTGYALSADKVAKAVEDAPTVDAVSVIRCRECEFAHMTFGGECKYCDAWADDEYLYLDGDFFCAFGKRRDEDDETD